MQRNSAVLLESFAACALLALSLGLRLHRLDSAPGVFFHDECDNTANALQILLGRGPGWYGLDWKPQPAFGVHLLSISLRMLGASLWAVRLPSALLGGLALAPFYLLARREAGVLAALGATALLSTHVGFLHFSRSGWENVQGCFWGLLALECFGGARRAPPAPGKGPLALCLAGRSEATPKGYFLGGYFLSGVFSGLAACTYFSGWATLIALQFHGVQGRSPWRGEGAEPLRARLPLDFTLGAALLLLPLLPTLFDPVFFRRIDNVADFEPLHNLAAFGLGWSHQQPRYFPDGLPLLPWPTLLLCLVGLLQPGPAAWRACLVAHLCTQLLAEPSLARGLFLIPLLHLYLALGLRRLARPRLALAACLLLALVQARTYWVWARSPELRAALEPAIPASDFERWRQDQVDWITHQPAGFIPVSVWKTDPRWNPEPPPDRSPSPPADPPPPG